VTNAENAIYATSFSETPGTVPLPGNSIAQRWAKGTGSELWFAAAGGSSTGVGVFDTSSLVTKLFATPVAPGGFIAPGPDGDMYFTGAATSNVYSVTPAGAVTSFTPSASRQHQFRLGFRAAISSG
jgi:hypothetical protein